MAALIPDEDFQDDGGTPMWRARPPVDTRSKARREWDAYPFWRKWLAFLVAAAILPFVVLFGGMMIVIALAAVGINLP